MTEKEFQSEVIRIGKMYGWLISHPYDSRRSEAGLPDLFMVREDGRAICAELKTETGRMTEAQKKWRSIIEKTAIEYYLWRPRHLQRIATILSRIYRPETHE